MGGRGSKPTKLKGDAKAPVARRPVGKDDSRVRDLETRLGEALAREAQALQREAEALEQQTATRRILQAISTSQSDLGVVFTTIAASATKLCDGAFSAVFRLDDDLVHLSAHDNFRPAALAAFQRAYPLRLSSDNPLGRCMVEHRAVHIADLEDSSDFSDAAGQRGKAIGYRALIAVPMLQGDRVIGAIGVGRETAGPFTERQITLLKTFADQAVIAVENVRLFTELQARNRDLSQSLERQTATAEILRTISSSPTDAQPVFNAIATHSLRLCAARFSAVYRVDGERIHLVAHTNFNAEALAILQAGFPRTPQETSHVGRAVLERAAVNVADVARAGDAPQGSHRHIARLAGYRGFLAVPMIREGQVVGCIALGREAAEPFPEEQVQLISTFADQAVIAIENGRLFKELQEKNGALMEALEQQTATAEILRVISSSPIDLRPVFDTIVRNAVNLCRATFGGLHQLDGERITLDAQYGVPEEDVTVLHREVFPLPLSRQSATGRAILDRNATHIPDIREDPAFRIPHLTQMQDYRTILAVPLIREGAPIGALALWRSEVRPFTAAEISLVQTFADQAVIAIENVRLFTALQEKNRALTEAHGQLTETLEQQTATAEILRAISSSPTAIQPVFDVIAQRCVELCDALYSGVFSYDNELVHLVAHHNWTPEALAEFHRTYPVRPSREDTLATWAILDRIVIHVPDILNEPGVPEDSRRLALARGYRSFLAAPMMRDGQPIGAIAVAKREPERFSDKQVDLLKIFADQAVIAIENVRLFKELQARNRDVTQALQQQTATAEVLQAISSSATDARPVFQTIVESAVRLSGALFGSVYRFDGEHIHMVAQHNYSAAALEFSRRFFPAPPNRGTFTGRAILERTMVHVPDVSQDQERLLARDLAESVGFRSALSVPMLHEGEPVGAITVWRADVGPFPDQHVELLRTFAAQAVIAIQNERLFQELQDRTAALSRSVDQLTALGEVGRAVVSTLDLETVLTTIVSRAVGLSGLDGGVVFEYAEAGREFVQRAQAGSGGALTAARRVTRIREGEGVVGRTAITLGPVQVADITAPGAYVGPNRDNLIESGVRAILAVPMVREDRLIGCLAVSRNQPGPFPAETVDLLRTFATQSALAIQNARLYHELADKSNQLELASQHKSEFLANMSHELRTPLNAIIGFSEVLTERMFGELNEKQDEYMKDIYASGQHLLSLINDILDLSKIEAGRMELELSDFDLPQAISNAVTLVRERAGRRGIALHQAVDQRLVKIRGDERKVKQVLLNLLSNALKFTPEGGRVDVRASLVDSTAEVAVTDTGVGIAPEDQEAVFEEFRQVGTADKKVEGTGLGLALSRKFIELHGGRIWVESRVGQGSTFTFTLPLGLHG